MANQEAKIFIKVEGIDTAVTGLKQLDKNLDKTTKSVDELDEATEDLNKTTKKGGDSVGELGGIASQIGGPIGALAGGIGKVTTATGLFDKALKILALNPIIIPFTAIIVALTTIIGAFTSTKEGGEALDRVFAGISAGIDVLRDGVVGAATALFKFATGDWRGALETAKGTLSDLNDGIDEIGEASKQTGVLQDLADEARDLALARSELNKELAQARLDAKDENLPLEERQKALQDVIAKEQEQADKELENQRKKVEALGVLDALSDTSAEDAEAFNQEKIKLDNLEIASINKKKQAQTELDKINRQIDKRDKKASDDRQKALDLEVAQAEQVAGVLAKIRLDAIEDEEQKAVKSIEIKKQEEIDKLKNLNATAEEIKELEAFYDAQIDSTKQFYADKEKQRQQDRVATNQDILDQIYFNELSQDERVEQAILAASDAEFEILNQALEAGLITKDEYEQKVVALNDRTTEALKANNEEVAEGDKATNEEILVASLQSAQQLIGALGRLDDVATKEKLKGVERGSAEEDKILREQFERRKKRQKAEALIGVALSVITALGSAPPPVNFILAGANAVAGAVQIAAIDKQTYDGGGSGSGPKPPGAGGSINYQLGNQQTGPDISLGQLSSGLDDSAQEPVKTYVIATDVTNAQEANSQIENLARL